MPEATGVERTRGCEDASSCFGGVLNHWYYTMLLCLQQVKPRSVRVTIADVSVVIINARDSDVKSRLSKRGRTLMKRDHHEPPILKMPRVALHLSSQIEINDNLSSPRLKH